MHICFELRLPEFHITRGRRRFVAFSVTMPETAVDENDRPMPGEDDVRRPWQAAPM